MTPKAARQSRAKRPFKTSMKNRRMAGKGKLNPKKKPAGKSSTSGTPQTVRQRPASGSKAAIERQGRGVIYVSHLPFGFYEEALFKFFGQFGGITNIRVGRSKQTGRSKGYAFIEFRYQEVAEVAAQTMNNYLMFNKLIKCQLVPRDKIRPQMFRKKVDAKRPPLLASRHSAKLLLNSVKTPATEAKRLRVTNKKLGKLKKKLSDMGIELDLNFGLKPGRLNSGDVDDTARDQLIIEIDSDPEISIRSPPAIVKVKKAQGETGHIETGKEIAANDSRHATIDQHLAKALTPCQETRINGNTTPRPFHTMQTTQARSPGTLKIPTGATTSTSKMIQAKAKSPMAKVTSAMVKSPMAKLTPAKAKSPMVSLAPAKVKSPMTKLTPAKAKSPMVSLTPGKVKSPMTKLTPAKAKSPMVSLTPAKVKSPMTKLTPAKAKSPMANLTPAKVKSPMTKLTPAKAKSPMANLTPAKAKSPMANFTSAKVKSPMNKLTPAKAKSPMANLTPAKAQSPSAKSSTSGLSPWALTMTPTAMATKSPPSGASLATAKSLASIAFGKGKTTACKQTPARPQSPGTTPAKAVWTGRTRRSLKCDSAEVSARRTDSPRRSMRLIKM